MGTIFQKLEYTKNSIDDIEKALSEKGYNMTLYILGDYASLIRKLGTGGGGQSFPSVTERECNYIIYCFNIPNNSVKMTIISPADFVNVKDNIVDYLLINKIPKLTLVNSDIIGNVVTRRKSLTPTYILYNDDINNTQNFNDISVNNIYVNKINKTINLNDNIINTHITQIEMEDN